LFCADDALSKKMSKLESRSLVDADSIPSSYNIQVPFYRQLNDFACGAASMQMILQYYNRTVNQYNVADVLRMEWTEGTFSTDMVRAGHFSVLSSSVGNYFPNATLEAGYPGYPLGLLAYWADSEESWLDSMKVIVASDIPVIVLMHYEPHGVNDGHFRIVTGYDDNTQQIIMNDPWAYENNANVQVWSYEDFNIAWNYTEPDSFRRPNTFYAAIVFPFELDVENFEVCENQAKVKVSAELPVLIEPFNGAQYDMSSILFSLDYDYEELSVSTDTSFAYQSFPSNTEGSRLSAEWDISCYGGCSGKSFSIELSAMVVGKTDLTFCCNSTTDAKVYYPIQTYRDVVGSETYFDM